MEAHPLYCFSYNKNVEIVKVLSNAGADFRIQDNGGNTALH